MVIVGYDPTHFFHPFTQTAVRYGVQKSRFSGAGWPHDGQELTGANPACHFIKDAAYGPVSVHCLRYYDTQLVPCDLDNGAFDNLARTHQQVTLVVLNPSHFITSKSLHVDALINIFSLLKNGRLIPLTSQIHSKKLKTKSTSILHGIRPLSVIPRLQCASSLRNSHQTGKPALCW